MTGRLAGKVGMVTGGGRGIGRAVALRLAREEASLVIAARTESELYGVAREVERFGVRCLPVPTDVTVDAQLERLVEAATKEFGAIDMLVNNAGGGPPRTSTVKASIADWDRTLQVNLRATMILSKLVLPHMVARRSGTIVNISSIAGKMGSAGEAAYAAAKFGVVGFTEALFEEVREHGIKVAVICPGYVDTALIPLNRRMDRAQMIRPEDVADVVFAVAASSSTCCPTEVIIRPQRNPLK